MPESAAGDATAPPHRTEQTALMDLLLTTQRATFYGYFGWRCFASLLMYESFRIQLPRRV